jgi:predicted Zn-dependent protease
LLENDDQLAGVLGHEVAHVINRHAYRSFRDYRRKQLGFHLFLIGTSVLPFPAGAAAYVISRISEPMAMATTSGYGVEFERQADQFSVAGLLLGGRDAVQIIRSFEQMDKSLDPEPIAMVGVPPLPVPAAYLAPDGYQFSNKGGTK